MWVSACPSTTQPSSCSSGAWPIARKSVWLLGRLWYSWHDICSPTAPRKMPRTESVSRFLFHQPDKGFQHCLHDGLWKIMSKFGCPPKFISLVHSLHDGMLPQVLNDGQSSYSFPVTNGVKQRCVLAVTLFRILFTTMLSEAFSDDEDSIKLCFHTDGNLFNLRRLQAQTKVKITSAGDRLFANDCALNANSEAGLQQSMNKFLSVCSTFGLTITTQKMQVMCQPAPHTI